MGQAVDELIALHKKELIVTQYEDEISERIAEFSSKKPETIARFCYVSRQPLYGTAASLYFGDERSEPFTHEQVLEVARKLPPTSAFLIEERGISFRSAEYVVSLSETQKVNWKREELVGSVRFKIKWLHLERLTRPALFAEWFSKIDGVGVVRVQVFLGSPTPLGRVYSQKYERKSGIHFEPTKFELSEKMRTIYFEDHYIAQYGGSIRWWRADDNVPNEMTVYFDDVEEYAPSMVGEAILTTLFNNVNFDEGIRYAKNKDYQLTWL